MTELEIVARLLGLGGGPDLLAVNPPAWAASVLYILGKIVRAAMMDTVLSSFFFSFGSPGPELTFGRLCRHHHPDNRNRKALSTAKSANEDRQPEPGCQPAAGGTAAL